MALGEDDWETGLARAVRPGGQGLPRGSSKNDTSLRYEFYRWTVSSDGTVLFTSA